MLLEMSLAFIAGIITGIFTGLTPGIHINTLAGIFISSSITLIFPSSHLVIFIVALAITHTFIDFIPSIYFGAPDEDTGLIPLPQHSFLIKGQGHQALLLTLTGSVLAISSLLAIIPLFVLFLPKIYPFIQTMMGFFLILVAIFLISGERENWKTSLVVFLLSGFLGIATLNSNLSGPLFPLLTGLFASSTLLNSIRSRTVVPKQFLGPLQISKSELVKPTLATVLVSPICSLLPGLGSAQAAVIGSTLMKRFSKEQFLILLGSINTLVMATSFITFNLISRTRTGAANFISELALSSPPSIKVLGLTILTTTLIVTPITLYLSKLFAKNIHKINYGKISLIILILISLLVFFISGFLGAIVYLIATILGLTCIELSVKRSFLMGCLLIPTTIIYLPF